MSLGPVSIRTESCFAREKPMRPERRFCVKRILLIVASICVFSVTWFTLHQGPRSMSQAPAPLRGTEVPAELVKTQNSISRATPKPEVSDGPETKAQDQSRPRSEDQATGTRISVSAHIDTVELTRDEFVKTHPNMKPEDLDRIFSGNATVQVVAPRTDGLPSVAFNELSTDCPALTESSTPIVLIVNGGGSILDATSLTGDPVPNAVFKCTISGGSDGSYKTTYVPSSLLPASALGSERAPASE